MTLLSFRYIWSVVHLLDLTWDLKRKLCQYWLGSLVSILFMDRNTVAVKIFEIKNKLLVCFNNFWKCTKLIKSKLRILMTIFFTSTKSWRGYIFITVLLMEKNYSLSVFVYQWTKFQPNPLTDLDAVFAKCLLTRLALAPLSWWRLFEGQGHIDAISFFLHHYYTSTKSWRGHIFTAVCLCVCVSVCLSVYVSTVFLQTDVPI